MQTLHWSEGQLSGSDVQQFTDETSIKYKKKNDYDHNNEMLFTVEVSGWLYGNQRIQNKTQREREQIDVETGGNISSQVV